MKPNLDKIEIQEPPLEHITKKRSCLKQTCSVGCGCLILVIIGLTMLLRFVATPKAKDIGHVPDSIEAAVPLYDKESITDVTEISGAKRAQSQRILTYVPRLLLVPVIVILDVDLPGTDKTGNPWQDAYTAVTKTEIDRRDTITISWQRLSATPNFIEAFYQTELKKAGFIVKKTPNARALHFSKGSIDGSVLIQDNEKTDGTDMVIVTIQVPQ